MMKKYLFIFSMLVAANLTAFAQDVKEILNSFNDTAIIPRDQAPLAADPIMEKKWNQIKTKHFNLNFGLAFLYDYNIVNQDEDNIEQVGAVSDKGEFRGQRLVASGNLLFFKHPWRYMISANYNGMDAPQGSKSFSFIDWNFEIPFGKKGGWITIGKQKEGVGHEYVAPGTQLMFTERGSGVPMFVRQRNIGIRYSNSIMNQRATYTLGLFNNYWETGNSFSENGSQITFRATGLPKYSSDADLLHIAFGYRYSGATNDKLSYKAKPEVNTAPSFINTGAFDASASNLMMFELIKVKGPLSFIGEFMNNIVSTPGPENGTFRYYTAGGSWFITGENRKYNKNNGNLGKLIPKKIFSFKKGSTGSGAFELGARYTSSDLNQGDFEGGVFNRWTGAFSWYPNAHFRFSVNYGNGKLKRDGQSGRTDFWQFRTQFEL
jgi:phosphate-selective porin OprO and OprP